MGGCRRYVNAYVLGLCAIASRKMDEWVPFPICSGTFQRLRGDKYLKNPSNCRVKFQRCLGTLGGRNFKMRRKKLFIPVDLPTNPEGLSKKDFVENLSSNDSKNMSREDAGYTWDCMQLLELRLVDENGDVDEMFDKEFSYEKAVKDKFVYRLMSEATNNVCKKDALFMWNCIFYYELLDYLPDEIRYDGNVVEFEDSDEMFEAADQVVDKLLKDECLLLRNLNLIDKDGNASQFLERLKCEKKDRKQWIIT